MKSFRIYLRDPATLPNPNVPDYSDDERLTLRRQFGSVALRYRRHVRLLFVVCFCLFGSMALLIPFSQSYTVRSIEIVLFVAAIVVLFYMPRLVCPGCGNRLVGDLGPFCPECGSRSVERKRWPQRSQCSACKRSLFVGKAHRYKICYCTHCGLLLDETGV